MIKKFLSLYSFAYKYILRVNASFAIPALGVYGYLLFRYQDSPINNILTNYIASASSHKLYINSVLSDNVLVDWDKFIENVLFYQNIVLFVVPLGILLLYVFTLVAFIRDLVSRNFTMKRTGKLMDDIGFAITFCSLTALFNILFAINFSGLEYLIMASLIQSTVFLFLLKNKAYGYSLKKRSIKIIT